MEKNIYDQLAEGENGLSYFQTAKEAHEFVRAAKKYFAENQLTVVYYTPKHPEVMTIEKYKEMQSKENL